MPEKHENAKVMAKNMLDARLELDRVIQWVVAGDIFDSVQVSALVPKLEVVKRILREV